MVAMALPITGFFTMFSDPGLSTATVQRLEISEAQMSNLFWLNVAFGASIMCAAASVSPVVAFFYRDPRVAGITASLACCFGISGFGVQHQAVLRRRMSFGRLAIIEISASAGSALTGVALALWGFGYWSLVLMQLSWAAIYTGSSWVASGWRPGKPSRGTGSRAMMIFGRNVTTFNFLNYFVRNLDNILIGWRWGPTALGLYSRAYQMLLLPLQQIVSPIGGVASPALSRLQADPKRFRSYFLQALSLIIYITAPVIVTMIIFSDEIILIFLGPRWHEASKIFRVLAISVVSQPLLSTLGWLYTTLDRTRAMIHWGAITVVLVPLSFVIGLHWGPIGVAIGFAFTECLLVYPGVRYAVKGTPISMRDVWIATYRPLSIALALGAVLFLCRRAFMSFGLTWMISLATLGGAVTVIAIVAFWEKARQDLRGIASAAATLRAA
jgi:O-antigen/teichoic acid export membrane protein